MGNQRPPDIQLVVTMALKKEAPIDWLASHNIPVHTIEALKSGALSLLEKKHRGILFVITGAGLKASREAALWIRENLSPLFILNIGTCGLTGKEHSPGQWIRPKSVSNEDGQQLTLDDRLPLPMSEKYIVADSLLSVRKASLGDIPEAWGKHNILDMECFAQAEVFSNTDITFHCIKFSTDYSDSNTHSDFNRNLELFREEIKKLFSSLELNPKAVKITAVVPVYNRSHTIKRAIDSVLSQSCLPEEVIVVDDCSIDNTGEILKGYGDKITIIRMPENSGPSAARNAGTRHARTEWIAFLDSDDCWEKDKLKGQIEYLNQYPFYQIMQSEEKWIRNGKRVNPCKHHKKPSGWIWKPSLERCLVSPSSALIKKSLLNQYGNFDEGLPVCEDYDLWLKISRHHPVGLDPNWSVIKYGGHDDQLSHQFPAMDRFRVKSLFNALADEPLPLCREKLIEIIAKKLDILITGYEKRERTEDAHECRELLESMKRYHEQH